MKLFDTLRQFKNIEPDSRFSERSKREILLTPQPAHRTMRGLMIFLHTIETGAAVALAGFFILILTNSFSPTRSISPIQASVIDPQVLHAEAQAIDMQIQLANIAYSQVTTTPATAESTTATPAAIGKAFSKTLATPTATSSPAVAVPDESSSTTPTTTLSVDQALLQLSH